MRYTKWYRVTYQGRKRFDSVNLDEATGFATRIWNEAGCKGLPLIEEYDAKAWTGNTFLPAEAVP